MGTELRKLNPETINRALIALRAELIRDGGLGLEHVEALLQLRGHNLAPVPRKATLHFRRNKLRMAIYRVLRDGPLTGPEIVEQVCAAHGLAYGVMYRSVYAQLYAMKRAGRVRNGGGIWWLPNLGLSQAAGTDHFHKSIQSELVVLPASGEGLGLAPAAVP